MNSSTKNDIRDTGRATSSMECACMIITSPRRSRNIITCSEAGGTLFSVKDCGQSSRDMIGTISECGFWRRTRRKHLWWLQRWRLWQHAFHCGGRRTNHDRKHGTHPTSWVYPTNPTYVLPEKVTNEHCYQIDGQNPSQGAGWVYLSLF